MPVEVILSTWTVSQEPLSTSVVRINSSIEITCSTNLSHPMGVYLHRGFHSNRDVAYLELQNGQVTIDTEFTGRIRIIQDEQITEGHGITLQLSLLGLTDTDLFYCSWIYFNSEKAMQETKSSTGTIIIIREGDPQESCKGHTQDLIYIVLTVAALILILFIGALIVRCKRFKKNFRPARAVKPSRPARPPHVCTQQRVHHCTYLTTSPITMDFSRIL